LFQLNDWLPRLPRGGRTTPRAIERPQSATHTIRADYRRGWSIAPRHERVVRLWLSFERLVGVEGDDLGVAAPLPRHADEVPAADYARFRSDMEAARDLLVYDIGLDAKPAILSARAADWAWPAAAFLLLPVLLALAWWHRHGDRLSGMVFAPRSTMAALLRHPRAWWTALALVAASAVLGAAPDLVGGARGGN